MQDFDYIAAQTVAEVVAVLERENGRARILAGGTDLLVQLREGRRSAAWIVDIKRIPELNQLSYDPQAGLVIGAGVPCFRLVDFCRLHGIYPGLVDAAGLIGGVQIQGRATLGGNLCNASPAADSIPALIVHRAVCHACGPDGWRQIAAEDLCLAPGRTSLGPAEMLVSISLPTPPARFGAHYLRFTPRNEMDIAVAGAAAGVVLTEDRSTFEDARLAIGAVAPTPLFLPQAGEFLSGKAVSAENIRLAAGYARAAAAPLNDTRGTSTQRIHLAEVLARRALTAAVARAGEQEVVVHG